MRDKSTDGAKARFQFLTKALSNSAPLSAEIQRALASQHSFARLRIKGEFDPVSLNTLKTASGKALQRHGGWAGLDGLRKQVLKQSQGSAGRTRTAKDARHGEDLAEKEMLLSAAEAANLLVTIAYQDLFSKLVGVIGDPSLTDLLRIRLQNTLNDHKMAYPAIHSPTEKPAKPSLRVINGGKE